MKRVNKYRIEISENGIGTLYVSKNGEEELLTNIGNVGGWPSDKINELALTVLANNGIELSNSQELICDYGEFTKNEKEDMNFIRNHMKKIVRSIDSNTYSREEKKEKYQEFQMSIMACKTIADTYKIDIAYNRVKPVEIIEVKK
jgi:hypothetical protein